LFIVLAENADNSFVYIPALIPAYIQVLPQCRHQVNLHIS